MSRPLLESAAVVGTFSRAGGGKTIDLVRAMPRGLIVAEPGALTSAIITLGYTPANIQTLATLYDVKEIFKKYLTDEKFDGLGIDDLTRISARTIPIIQKSYSGWKIWEHFAALLSEIFDDARRYKKFVLFNGHEREERTDSRSNFVRGGIDLPMKQTETISGAVDGMFRVVQYSAEDAPLHPHPFAFYSPAGDPKWAVKTRFGNPPWSPMNLGQILRSVDYKGGLQLRRGIGLEWQEKAVKAVAERLLATGGDPAKVKEQLKLARDTMIAKGGLNPAHILWVLHDAEDEARLIAAKSNALAIYG